MTALDDRLVPLVLEIVERLGKLVTFTVYGTYAYDEETGAGSESDSTTYDKYITPPDKYADEYVDGDVVQAGDVRIYLPASGLEFTPAMAMPVEIDSETWRVVSAGKHYSGDLVALWELQLRR